MKIVWMEMGQTKTQKDRKGGERKGGGEAENVEGEKRWGERE